jgi:hypothetical protein
VLLNVTNAVVEKIIRKVSLRRFDRANPQWCTPDTATGIAPQRKIHAGEKIYASFARAGPFSQKIELN